MKERWLQIERLFHEAIELGPDQRAEFIAQRCEENGVLRKELESILASINTPINIIDHPPTIEAVQLLANEQPISLEGKTIQHYKILARLGRGGMGDVYGAVDQRLNRKVALKFLPISFTEHEEQVNRLQQEARTASALNHPNIVTIYDIGQADSFHFIAMEFVEGETLRQKMAGQQMSLREVLNIAIQVTSGLSAAHQAGILHRDVKPENIMEANDGYFKILDFGIAKFNETRIVVAEECNAGPTTSVAAGTLSYMSPEQARGEALDARTDIFSVGVLLFELATGRRPFTGESQEEILRSLLENEAPSITSLRANIPADLARIVAKALKKKREERFQSAKEMLADLRDTDRITGEGMDATERANRMLRQYLSIYSVDRRALIPLTKLGFIRRYTDLERGDRTRELLKKSFQIGVLKFGALFVLLLFLTTIGAAAWSVEENWNEVILKDGHTRAVRQAAFSPDGSRLVSVGEDAKIIVWNFIKRIPETTLTAHTKAVISVDFSPNGKWFATGSEDNTVIIWDAARLERVAVLQSHSGEVIAVAFSPDGRWLASASHESGEDRIVLTEVETWREARQMKAGGWDYAKLIFSPNSRWLTFSDGTKWDVTSGQQVSDEVVGWGGKWMALSRDGKRLIGVGTSGAVNSYNVPLQQRGEQQLAHQDSGRAAAFSSDGQFAATGADDVVLWDAATMNNIGRFEYPSVVWHVMFSPDGKWLVSTHGDGAIVIWDVKNRKLAATLNGHGGPVQSVAFSHDGRHIASAGDDGSVIVWNSSTGRKEQVVLSGTPRLTAVAFSKDGTKLAFSEFDHSATLWDLETERPSLILNVFGGSNYCVDISADGGWIAATDGVYSASDGSQIVSFEKEIGPKNGQMYSAAFSPDGRWLVGVSPTKVLALFDTSTWELRKRVDVSDVTFISVSLSPDGKELVTGDDEGTVRLWELESLRQVAVIGRHSSRIKSVAISPNGQEVCSAGDDQTIALWQVQSRRLITKIGTHTAGVLAVAFSPNGKQIVSGEHDGSVRLYTRHHSLWGWRLN